MTQPSSWMKTHHLVLGLWHTGSQRPGVPRPISTFCPLKCGGISTSPKRTLQLRKPGHWVCASHNCILVTQSASIRFLQVLSSSFSKMYELDIISTPTSHSTLTASKHVWTPMSDQSLVYGGALPVCFSSSHQNSQGSTWLRYPWMTSGFSILGSPAGFQIT